MKRLKIRESDLVEKFVLGSGSGGQKVNKTSSCVFLRHGPSKIEIHCQEGRSREANRITARERLCAKLEEQLKKKRLELARKRALRRVAKRKPSAAAKARKRQLKKLRSEKKSNRKKIT